MKILYITTHYTIKNNSAVVRNNALVKGLKAYGNIVDVYTVNWPKHMLSSYFIKENNGNISFSSLKEISTNDSLKQKFNITNTYANRIKKIIKAIVYFPDVCHYWHKVINVQNISEFDLMITSSDYKSSHFVGLKIKKENPNLKWVQIWGDPWSNDLHSLYLQKPLIKLYERLLIKKCDKAVYISRPTADILKTNYPTFKDKIHYIPRSYYIPIKKKKLHSNTNDYIQIAYCGSIATGRDINLFLQSIEDYSTTSTSKFKINLFGNYSNAQITELKRYSSIQINEAVDYDNIPEVYQNADILLYMSNSKGSSQIPGKLYEYFGTECLIICLVYDLKDPISQFINEHGNKCILIKNELNSIKNSIPIILESLKENHHILDFYSPENIARHIIDLTEDIN